MAAKDEIKEEITSGEGGCDLELLDEGEGSVVDLAVEGRRRREDLGV